MKTQKLLTAEEAAERLGLKVSTIRRKILTRTIVTVKLGRSVRIPVEAVDRLINDGWREPVSLEKAAR